MTIFIKNILIQTHLNQTIIALNPTSTFQSLRRLPHTGQLVTLTFNHLLLNFPMLKCIHLIKRRSSFVTFLRTILDRHAPPSLLKVITHNSSPWFESIRDELFMAKIERRQAERKWSNTKLTIFKELYIQVKHKVSKRVHTVKCKFYNERIAVASSISERMHSSFCTLII